MPALKDVKLQIAGVGKTRQITKAMGMVASSKLRGAQMRIERFRPYAAKFGQILGDLAAAGTEGVTHPLLQIHSPRRNVVILLLTSDRGLCGSFNANLISAAFALAGNKAKEGKIVRFVCVGRKGRDAVRKSDFEILEAYTDVMNSFSFQLAARLGSVVTRLYAGREADEVHMVYSEFFSMARQTAMTLPLLPLEADAAPDGRGEAKGSSPEYLYEPEAGVLLAELLPRHVNVQIYRGLLDTSAGENAARRTAMDNATRNCDELSASLTLLYNKTRQATITNDLMDIVGGANALQGQ